MSKVLKAGLLVFPPCVISTFTQGGDTSTSSATWLLAVVLFHALQALQQVVHLVFDLRQLPLDGLQIIRLHCRRRRRSRKWSVKLRHWCRGDGATFLSRTCARGPLAAFGGRGEAGFGSSAPSSAQTDPRTLGGDDGARQRGRRGRHTGLVGVHPEKQAC